jgi:hypothetical protein
MPFGTSDRGRLHRGEYAEIREYAADPVSGELKRLTVRLDSGETVELPPTDVETPYI